MKNSPQTKLSKPSSCRVVFKMSKRRHADVTELLDTDEQEQVIQSFELRINQQAICWKRTFACMSVVLALAVAISYLTDSSWYPSFLNRTTYGQTPSSSTALCLTVVFTSSLLLTGITFFQSWTSRDALLVVTLNGMASLLIAVLTPSRSWSLLLPVLYQCLCSFAMQTLHDTDDDLRTLKKKKYNYKTA